MAKKRDKTPDVIESDGARGDEVLSTVIDDFDKARKYIKEHYESIWDECFKSYNGIRTRRGYDGVADEFAQETFSIVESLKASIAGSKPKFKFFPLREDQEQDTDIINDLVDYYWAQNNMTEKMLNWIGDMIVYGNGIFYVSWNEDRPLIQHIPLSDFFVDPAATQMNHPGEPGYPRYAGYRYLTSLKELKEARTTNEDGDVVSKYKNLDKINNDTTNDDKTDKDRKESYLGSTYGSDAIKEQVEVIVHFTCKKKRLIANRGAVIFDEENPYYRDSYEIPTTVELDGQIVSGKQTVPPIKGFLPFAILRNYVDSNLFFARGDVEVILPAQEALNDTASQKRDNLAYVLNNMWQIDPRFKHLADQIESEPGAIFPIPKGALNPIDKQDISSAADIEIARQVQIMRGATAADAAVQGVAQKFSRTTATEVSAQLNQAGMRFTTKVQNLEDEGFAQLARIIFKMIQIFVTDGITVRQLGARGISWNDFNPGRYWGEYQPRVILEATARSENAELSQKMQAAAQFSLNNPLVNQVAFLRKFYKVLFTDTSDEDIEELLTTPQPIMGPDGQAIDPALQQGNAKVSPEAAARLRGQIPSDGASFAGTTRGRASQSGSMGGGGADSAGANIRRLRANQPSTKLSASSQAKK